MFGYEMLAIAYLAGLAAVAPLTRAQRRKVWRTVAIAAALIVFILILVRSMPASGRAWFGHAYLLAAYWLPALLVAGSSNGRLEAWLSRSDTVWQKYAGRCPSWAATVLDMSYMGCYVMVPVAFFIIWLRVDQAAVNRFWLAVLIAGFACYSSLPWLVSSPPRVRDPLSVRRANAVRHINLFVLGRLSHGLNTFPSGHVAVSLAAALMVATVSPTVGAPLIVIAAGIAAGAVVGRYHYLVDVLLGAIIGALAALIASRV